MGSVAGGVKAHRAGGPAPRTFPWLGLAALLCAGAAPANAEEHIVRTRRSEWAPSVLFIQPGDTVVWRGMEGHETALIEGMGPPGAEHWKSALDADGFRVSFEQPGAYIYTCDIHMNAGMVGAIVVGDAPPGNLAAIDAAVPGIQTGRVFVERIVARMKRELERRQ
jgi:plastocyanin